MYQIRYIVGNDGDIASLCILTPRDLASAVSILEGSPSVGCYVVEGFAETKLPRDFGFGACPKWRESLFGGDEAK